MADYSKSRAKKKESKNVEIKETLSKNEKKKITNKVKKSPVLLIALVFLVLGAACGYFAFSYLSAFEMNGYKVNGVESQEVDYVVVEREAIDGDIVLEDGGVTCKIFGIDVSSSITVKYYYREDTSYDAQEVEGITLETAGVYYIEYSSSNFLYKHKKLIRTIVITEVENG